MISSAYTRVDKSDDEKRFLDNTGQNRKNCPVCISNKNVFQERNKS